MNYVKLLSSYFYSEKDKIYTNNIKDIKEKNEIKSLIDFDKFDEDNKNCINRIMLYNKNSIIKPNKIVYVNKKNLL
jgi:hypothetical protein